MKIKLITLVASAALLPASVMAQNYQYAPQRQAIQIAPQAAERYVPVEQRQVQKQGKLAEIFSKITGKQAEYDYDDDGKGKAYAYGKHKNKSNKGNAYGKNKERVTTHGYLHGQAMREQAQQRSYVYRQDGEHRNEHSYGGYGNSNGKGRPF